MSVLAMEDLNLAGKPAIGCVRKADHLPGTLVHPAIGRIRMAGHAYFHPACHGEVNIVRLHMIFLFPFWITADPIVPFTEFRPDNALGIGR